MRLIKENTQRFESFHKSLQYFTKNSETKGDLRLISFEDHRTQNQILEKYSFFIQNISSFQRKIQNAKNLLEIHTVTKDFVKRIINSKEVELFIFNENNRHLIPINKEANPVHINSVNKAYKDGILDWIFETKKATIIPDLSSYTINGSKINQIIFPVYDSRSNFGVLSVYSSLVKIQEDSIENKAIQIILGIVVPIIISLRQKNSINKLYQELQVYQSKIQNDFDTYAIGNLAEGILEEIGEPLQVILSLSELIETDYQNVDKEITQKIKKQVGKVNELTNRLTKFASLNKPKNSAVQPCYINKIVKEFRNIINMTLQNLGLDCELDLEDNLPPILADANEIKQMLTSIFSLLKSVSKNGGGFIIQTKLIKEKVVLSVFTTETIGNDAKTNVTVNLINELMKKNEGVAEISSLPLKGTIIHLIFPLKRKLAL
ncbi:MAG: hypothetical protein AB1695_11180 [Stygiobacter sp.]|jgi:light-regulated signal transduction histidine kinase (bacteriophytochrome)|uniref:Histidine kinase domain-containing protein n=1 Tax=Stygiobacter electus TaxID=3032292 RepID=A0AAE3TDH8_9BACT|nr:hypothetical protein [Stygiobacter electus]MDF1611238.1 hypothetical protein [Stygiobacter electus]